MAKENTNNNPVVQTAAAAPITNPLTQTTPSTDVQASDEASAPAPVVKGETGEAKKSEKKNTVEVPVETLQQLLNRIESLEKTSKEHESTFDQDQIMKIERLRASGKLVKNVRINSYEGKVVSSWRSIRDDVFVDINGREQAVQRIEVAFKDGSTTEVALIDFARRKTQKEYEVISEARNQLGQLMMTVHLEGGEPFTIESSFVN